jgi:hypothetical protein
MNASQTTYSFTRACSSAIAAVCGPAPDPITLNAGQSSNADIAFTATSTPNATGTITLTATSGSYTSTGTFTVTVQPPEDTARITLSLAGLNAGSANARDQCLTIAAGDAAAYECGDLRVVHALPTVTTMNKARTPTLIYNSRHAKPSVLIATDLVVRDSAPTSVQPTRRARPSRGILPAFVRSVAPC